MNIEVRYQSRGGNTKAVAQVIANEYDVEAQSIDIPIYGKTDVLFIGGGVYCWKADPKLLDYIKQLDPNQVGKVIAFCTSGSMSVTNKQIIKCSSKLGIPTYEKSLCLNLMLQGHSALGRQGGNLKEAQLTEIKRFIDEVKSSMPIS